MKSRVIIENRLRELLVQELEKRVRREVLPELCVHNYRHPLDHRRTVYGERNEMYNRISSGEESGLSLPVVQTIGLCMFGSESNESWPGNVCEEPLDAQRCPLFEYRVSREAVYQEFLSDLSDPAWVEASLPAVHSLLWVLGASLSVKRPSGLARLWAWAVRIFFGGPHEKSADVSVYLPAPDAVPDENSSRTTPQH